MHTQTSPHTLLCTQLAALPDAHVFVGRTRLSLEDVRSWISLRAQQYTLHLNDCRHYVDSLVHYATGAWCCLFAGQVMPAAGPGTRATDAWRGRALTAPHRAPHPAQAWTARLPAA